MSRMTYMTYMTYGISHTYIFQYGCQKNVRNAANHLIYPIKLFLGPKMKYPVFGFFLCIFQNISCIFYLAWGTPKSSNIQLTFFVVSNLIYSNGKTCWILKINFGKSDTPYGWLCKQIKCNWPSLFTSYKR